MKRVLLIGGTDSSGGAGLIRDAAVAHDFGCLGKPVVTCVTAQSNAAVLLIHEVPASVIVAQICPQLSPRRLPLLLQWLTPNVRGELSYRVFV